MTARDQAARARLGRFLRYSRKIPTKRLVIPGRPSAYPTCATEAGTILKRITLGERKGPRAPNPEHHAHPGQERKPGDPEEGRETP